MKTLKDLAKQIGTTGIVTRKFTEDCKHIGGADGFIKFYDGKIFPMRQCTLNMKKTESGFEYIDSVQINLNK
jgi:hypothetical protein